MNVLQQCLVGIVAVLLVGMQPASDEVFEGRWAIKGGVELRKEIKMSTDNKVDSSWTFSDNTLSLTVNTKNRVKASYQIDNKEKTITIKFLEGDYKDRKQNGRYKFQSSDGKKQLHLMLGMKAESITPQADQFNIDTAREKSRFSYYIFERIK